MNNLTIALTGAGGPAIPGMVDTLRKGLSKEYNLKILGLDMDPNAIGFFLVDKGITIPAGNSDEFTQKIKNICSEEKVDVFISVVDEELESCLELENQGIKVIQPEKEFVKLCLDKQKLMQRMKDESLPYIPTISATDIDFSIIKFPAILKPRTGRGSRGISIVHDSEQLKNSIQKSNYSLDNLIIQDFIEGPEFTVSVIVWRDGKVQNVVPKKIISKIGITRQAITEYNEKIHTACVNIQNKLKANGPFNVQLKLDKNSGEPFIFEINPRFSTSITLTCAAGVDELTGLVLQSLGKEFKLDNPFKEGVLMYRRMQDIFLNTLTNESI